MVLYSIVTNEHIGIHGCDISLQRAAEAAGIKYERIIAPDISLDEITEMKFAPGLLYRISTGAKSAAVEALMSEFHPHLTTIYAPKTITHPSMILREIREQVKAGLPIIPTRFIDDTWQNHSDDVLQEKTDSLGGFPVIVKQLGLSHGEGVKKVDTLQDLKATVKDVAVSVQGAIIARKYLSDYRHYRLIVIGDQVAAVIEYHKPEDDFRTNASAEPTVSAVDTGTLDASILDMAMKSVALRASIFGGVDVLVDLETGTPYIAEVNVPCYFARAEKPTGIDIAGQLIQALAKKHDREQA